MVKAATNFVITLFCIFLLQGCFLLNQEDKKPPHCYINEYSCVDTKNNTFSISFYEPRYSNQNSSKQSFFCLESTNNNILFGYHTIILTDNKGTKLYQSDYNVRCTNILSANKVVAVNENGELIVIDNKGVILKKISVKNDIDIITAFIETNNAGEIYLFDKSKCVKYSGNLDMIWEKTWSFKINDEYTYELGYYHLLINSANQIILPKIKVKNTGENKVYNRLEGLDFYDADLNFINSVSLDFNKRPVKNLVNLAKMDDNTIAVHTNDSTYTINTEGKVATAFASSNYELIKVLRPDQIVLLGFTDQYVPIKIVDKNGLLIKYFEVKHGVNSSARVRSLMMDMITLSNGKYFTSVFNFGCGAYDTKRNYVLNASLTDADGNTPPCR